MNVLDTLFPAPQPSKRGRPENIVYWVDERPPVGTLLSAGTQHALISLMFALYAVLAATGSGMGTVDAAYYTCSCIFIIGLGSAFQGLRTRFSPGMLLVSVPNPVSLGTYVAVTTAYGMGAAAVAIIIANVAVLFLARFLPRMRAVFPPEVIGVVILMLGLSLIGGGITRVTGLTDGGAGGLSPAALISGAATVIALVVLSTWGSAYLKTMAVVIGAGFGLAVAFLTGAVETASFASLASLPSFALPLIGSGLPELEVVPLAILALFVTELISGLDEFGSNLAVDRMNDATWHRADMPMISRGVTAGAIINIVQGFAGTLTSGSSTANIGLAHATGITSRYVGIAAGLILSAAAFSPQLIGLIVLTPAPVVGGILIYTSAYMIVSGMELILSRMMNERRTFTVGLSIVAGTSVLLVPELVQASPEWSHAIVGSGMTIGSIAAVSLNALFRIGVKQTAVINLTPADGGRQATDLLDHQGRAWGARREVVLRAGLAIGESVETIRELQHGDEPIKLTVTFDEFNLVCTFSYHGRPLELGPVGPLDAASLLDSDDDVDLDAAVARVSSVMINRLADRVHSRRVGDTCELQLHFNH